MSALNIKQRLFISEYMVDRNGTQAAIRSGYAKGSAHVQAARMLRNAKVAAEIDRRSHALQDELNIDAKYVIMQLKELADRCMQHTPGKWKFDAAGANRALELLGKHLGLFSTKVDISHSGQPIEIRWENEGE
jgi:phage terminase small subunit